MREKDSRPRVDSDTEDEPVSKRSRVNDDQPTISQGDDVHQPAVSQPSAADVDNHPPKGLLSLSDDILLHLLSYVNIEDLLALGESDDRLRAIADDKAFWRICDLRPRILDLPTQLAIARGLKPATSLFATRGPVGTLSDPNAAKQPTWTLDCMLALTKEAPNLKTLIIESHVIDCASILIEHFPRSVEVLSLRNCDFLNVPTQRSYFMNVHSSLTSLKSLDLTDCSWFSSHSLLALSKCFPLEELVLTGCEMYQCMPYASLAANYGFPNLRLLDLRNTAVGDSDVTCFNRMDSLRHLYLSPPSSAGNTTGGGQRFSCNVTDFSVCTFGVSPMIRRRIIHPTGIFGPMQDADGLPSQLESLVLNGYPGVTDLSLEHVALAMSKLKLLDVTGTSVTVRGIAQFRAARPQVQLISSHNE
ncbi:F-box and leucine-rich repeat protein 12 [Nesidiocoris tenuis]|uniref:F-box and leucine-rich repeat protein 12 n=1 Tax=Nesidiocoris tenuis TaxID=355587 RepID=A0ABN7AZ17_9HEMI|nr:F-box and leucine-rich repeat protein 12 [Nesidiocoris tenuis]